MKRLNALKNILLLLGLDGMAVAQQLPTVSEKDFLAEMPIVLSVSRLPQRLDETPGAVTILDRQMIRMSGARDVADLLRLVPGFRVTNSFESNTPQGSYHTSLDDYSNHMQIMVDGRSVYSVYLQGSTGPGLQTMALEDIERIEIHRGSNSAAYGARAFLGTINIVTRDPIETQGTHAQLAGGDNGIQDGFARVGWGDDRARFRLSADSRSDRGLRGSSGTDNVRRINLRADMRLSPQDLLELRTGQSVIEAGVGFPTQDGNAPRTRGIDTSFLQMDWRRNIDTDEDLSLQLSRTVETIRDNFPFGSMPSLKVDFGGRAANDNLSLQHTLRASRTLRLVWGGELRRESVTSRALYDSDEVFMTDFSRVFGNAEWRPYPSLVVNAGALFERSSIAGEHLSPRTMVNWHVAAGHTLRYGLTQAFRPPSSYEKFANVRYYSGGTLLDSTDVSRGNAQAEKIQTRELGYLVEWPRLGLNLDLRVFEEKIRGLIKRITYDLPGSGGTGSSANRANDYVNSEDFNIHGYEYQLKWTPWRDGQLIFSQALVDSTQSVGSGTHRPYGSQSLMLMQHLPAGLDVSLMYFSADAAHFPGEDLPAPAWSRTDVRLAKAMRLGGKPAELSIVVQNLGASYPDFIPAFRFYQQAYVMLRLEN